jgi:hypothetical protein
MDAGGPISFNTGGGVLTAIGSRFSFGAGVLALNNDPGATRYGAGSFTASVPEPTSWAMLLAGFGLVGFAARRRRITVAA